jgi:hypothetical protein
MQSINFHISALWATLIYWLLPQPQVRVEVKTITEVQLNPRGLIRTDIDFIKKQLPTVHWKPGDSLQDVAYRQGQADLLHFIENTVIGRRIS